METSSWSEEDLLSKALGTTSGSKEFKFSGRNSFCDKGKHECRHIFIHLKCIYYKELFLHARPCARLCHGLGVEVRREVKQSVRA